MRATPFDFIGNLDTLLAVMVGALLATLGALVAELIQDRLGRKRRQRDSARFFGEIMTSVDQIFDLACETTKVGERWGLYTRNLFETALREVSIYERNRERLFDIQDMGLRFAIHGHMLRFAGAISGISQQCHQIEALQARLVEDGGLSDSAKLALRNHIERMEAFREGALGGAQEQRTISAGILARLEVLAEARFDARY